MRLHEIAGEFDEAKFERDCAFYLEKMGHYANGTYLYRGTTSERMRPGRLNPWKPRSRPVDTPAEIHDALNEYFESDREFKKPWRNGLFTTGSLVVAETYGEPYIIVPAGKFEWLSNPEIEDLYTVVQDMQHEGMREDEIMEKVVEMVSMSTKWKHNRDLPGCVNSRCEVTLWCPDGYYAFDAEEREDLPRAIS